MDPGQGNARGLSNYILNFLFKQYSEYHSATLPFDILPQSFIDMRDPITKAEQYTIYGEPGYPTNWTPELLKYARDKTIRQYTTWIAHDTNPETIVRGLVVPHLDAVLYVTHKIVEYWHLSTPNGLLPSTRKEEFSAFLDALGSRMLYHPTLKPTESIIPPISSNTYYTELDAQLTRLKANAETKIAKNKYTPTEPSVERQARKRNLLCTTILEASVIIDPNLPPKQLLYRCKKPAMYAIRIHTTDSLVCESCWYDRTKDLPQDSYISIPIANYEPPPRESTVGRPPKQVTPSQNKPIKLRVVRKNV